LSKRGILLRLKISPVIHEERKKLVPPSITVPATVKNIVANVEFAFI